MYDVCVAGGGMIGAAIALGLAKRGLSVALVEQQQPAPFVPGSQPDLRLSALSASSIALLDKLGAWQHIAAMRVHPYRRLAVWERPDCRTDFDAADIQAEVLGYMVENRVIQLGLHKALEEVSSVRCFSDTSISQWQDDGNGENQIQLSKGETLQARWMIAADGARSQLRQMAGIGVQGWQYNQQAMGILIRREQDAGDMTWQAFHPSGPRAYLPMSDNHASLIWYDAPAKLRALGQLTHQQLKSQVLAEFPSLAGDFEVLGSAQFPLVRQHANQYVKNNLLLMGDAAHSINPLAGQGLNLGYQDVSTLLALIDKNSTPAALDSNVAKQYEKQRRRANLAMMTLMDGLYLTFSNDVSALKLLRNAALKLANRATPAKQQVMKYAMGLANISEKL